MVSNGLHKFLTRIISHRCLELEWFGIVLQVILKGFVHVLPIADG